MWKRLQLGRILAEVGLSQRACMLTELMTLNRLVQPSSEHAMPDWVRRTALDDILKDDFSVLSDDALYLNLDRLHPNRQTIESALANRERQLFDLDDTYYLYDLTSTYFEGQCLANPKAKRGYSRDKRPDCKQVMVGLVLDRDGFPKAHEVFDGNRQDRTSLDEMLGILEERTGRRGGATVIVDRGMAFDENLAQVKARGHHYVVASRQSERNSWLAEFEDDEGWEEVVRTPSPRNPAQKKTRVWVKRQDKHEEVYVLCRSEGREKKDRAIRDKHEQRLLRDLGKLKARVTAGRLKNSDKIHEAIGRLRERYPRVARYYRITYEAATGELTQVEDSEKKEKARQVDGAYLLRTDRKDLSADELWRLYILLTRVEDAFRDMKSPLSERPIFHKLAHRVETHIFLCVLAYHLLACIEKAFLDQAIHTSWATLREQLRTHQVITVVLPTADGRALTIRRATTPEAEHREIYDVLKVPHEPMAPVKLWRELGG
jgi:transposase